MSGPGLDELAARLRSGDAKVRRIAAMDLGAAAGGEPRATGILAGHLKAETDEKTAVAIIRHLGRARHGASRALLWSLYADRRTPARVAHAAILAHDAIELGALGRADRDPTMGPCAAEHR